MDWLLLVGIMVALLAPWAALYAAAHYIGLPRGLKRRLEINTRSYVVVKRNGKVVYQGPYEGAPEVFRRRIEELTNLDAELKELNQELKRESKKPREPRC